MRSLPSFLRPLLLGFCTVLLAACGDEIVGQKSCTTEDDCLKIAGDIYNADSGVGTAPECCNNVCVVIAGGCESGYRFLTTLPGYGACVADPMCAAVQNDMSVPSDLAKQD